MTNNIQIRDEVIHTKTDLKSMREYTHLHAANNVPAKFAQLNLESN
ncbi:hypothetical protein AOR13_1295 [Alteromonas stellipolaris LMG 21856]|nr:hypothetical protein AOR13_1295 [Alteromonas stellipolaris LMG 21856]